MRFVLTYAGPLPSNGNSAQKHDIRRVLQPQLKEQWAIDPALDAIARSTDNGITKLEQLATKFARRGFRFVPLVMREYRFRTVAAYGPVSGDDWKLVVGPLELFHAC